MEQRFCTKCGASLRADSSLCPVCGEKVRSTAADAEVQPRFCTKCGARTPVESDRCPVCGEPVRKAARPAQAAAPAADAGRMIGRRAAAVRTEVSLRLDDGTAYDLAQPETYIGRVPSNTIVIDNPRISRQHARVVQTQGQVLLEDLRSTNGTFVNGERVTTPVPLRDGDTITLGDNNIKIYVVLRQIPLQPEVPSHDNFAAAAPAAGLAVTEVAGAPPAMRVVVSLTALDGTVYDLTEHETYIGRVPSNTIAIDNPRVSRQHARIIQTGGQVLLEDLHSTNGTFLNDERVIAPVPLQDGDIIMLGDENARMQVAIREIALPPRPAVHVTEVVPPPVPAPAPVLRPAVRESMIALRDVVKRYRSGESEITVLKGISLEIGTGEFVVLQGPSGCGKTTTLNMIIGIDRPDAGEVIVAGQAVHRLGEDELARWRGRHIGVVFQFFQLLPTLTVIENVMMPMHFTDTYKKRERRRRALECLELVGMAQMADRFPNALSGGQQQRVAIARALACDPAIIVADEPTGNLDSQNSQHVFELLTELNDRGKTIVMVTHDPVLARAVPRRIEMLDGEIIG